MASIAGLKITGGRGQFSRPLHQDWSIPAELQWLPSPVAIPSSGTSWHWVALKLGQVPPNNLPTFWISWGFFSLHMPEVMPVHHPADFPQSRGRVASKRDPWLPPLLLEAAKGRHFHLPSSRQWRQRLCIPSCTLDNSPWAFMDTPRPATAALLPSSSKTPSRLVALLFLLRHPPPVSPFPVKNQKHFEVLQLWFLGASCSVAPIQNLGLAYIFKASSQSSELLIWILCPSVT